MESHCCFCKPSKMMFTFDYGNNYINCEIIISGSNSITIILNSVKTKTHGIQTTKYPQPQNPQTPDPPEPVWFKLTWNDF